MASYIEIFKSKLNWANVLERTAPVPLDRTSIWGSFEDAQNYAYGSGDSRELGATSYIGQVVTVYENDKVEVYKIGPTRELEKIGNGLGSIVVENYSAALELATAENVGQILYATTEEEYSGTTYGTGPYIVTGAGTVQKLASSSPSGDYGDDIRELQNRATALEEKQAEDDIIHLITGDDID